MSLSKRKKVNLIIVICFLVTTACFVADGNAAAGAVTFITGGVFLGLYKIFEKFSRKK